MEFKTLYPGNFERSGLDCRERERGFIHMSSSVRSLYPKLAHTCQDVLAGHGTVYDVVVSCKRLCSLDAVKSQPPRLDRDQHGETGV